MSAKKRKSTTGAAVSFWYQCSKCNKKIPRSISLKHGEPDCKLSFPFIKDQTAYMILSEVPSNYRIATLPCLSTRFVNWMLFLSDETIKECGFKSFEWVTAIPFEPENSDTESNQSVALAFQVWPVTEANSISGSSSGAFLAPSAFNTVPWLNLKQSVKLQKIPQLSFNKPVPILSECLLEVDTDEWKFNTEDQDRLVANFCRLFNNRIVGDGNVFNFKFYTKILPIRLSIQNDTSTDPENEGTHLVEEKLGELTLSEGRDRLPKFYEVTLRTNFILKVSCSQSVREHLQDFVILEQVGGLDSVITEISSTIEYILKTTKDKPVGTNISSSFPVGIILYGNHGTGKSLLARAICNHFGLNIIEYQESTTTAASVRSTRQGNSYTAISSHLNDIFSDAVKNCSSAVIIENLDVLGTKVSSRLTDSNSTFISHLRSHVEKLNSSRVPVIVLATCTELDSVDISLRSPHIFGKEIEVPVPAANQRLDILSKLLKSIGHNLTEENIKEIAANTHGFVGADLKSLLSQSSLHAMMKNSATTSLGIEDVEECIKNVHPSAMKSILIDVPNVKWEDIGGQKDLKFKLRQAIEWPLKHPDAFRRLGITPPKGILMYGPPGCSKTMIAKALATESGLNFISVKGSELFSKWVGESEKAVKALFRKSRQVAPCIIFFDELDSLGSERGSSGSGASNVHERVLAQLLIEIDGIEPLKDVTIVAATNRPDIIDSALLRPGRLDRIVYVPLPDEETRLEILKIHFKKMPVVQGINLEDLVQRTAGYSGAELTAVCHEAALISLEESIEATQILESHFHQALRLVSPRTTKEQIEFYDKYSLQRQI